MDCKHFNACNANLCPLDPELTHRTWFIGEAVCKRKDHASLPMIKRQKQLNKKRPKEYAGKPLRSPWLEDTAPRERVLSDEHRASLAEKMKNVRQRIGRKDAV